MVNATINRKDHVLVFEYPKHTGMKTECIKFTDNNHAMRLWRLRQRSYIMNTLMKFKRQRTHALAQYMTAEQQHAIVEIHEVLLYEYEGRDLKYFLMQIMKLSRYVTVIAPSPKSRFYEHYVTEIVPMFHWMNQFLGKN